MRLYTTVLHPYEEEYVVNKSRFIGRCYPVSTEEEIQGILTELRKRHYDASHNCYAYSLGKRGEIARYSDDREPSGTAGLPMMEVIKHKSVTDVLVVVTRYFGGILLGAGGLVRAYTKAASLALEGAGVVHFNSAKRLSLSVDYSLYQIVDPLVRSYAKELSQEFGERVDMRICVLEEDTPSFLKAMQEKSNGRAVPEILEDCMVALQE